MNVHLYYDYLRLRDRPSNTPQPAETCRRRGSTTNGSTLHDCVCGVRTTWGTRAASNFLKSRKRDSSKPSLTPMAASKVIILTGASRGLGWVIAHDLLQRSHNLVLLSRTEAPLHELEKQYSGQVAILAGDLADFSLAAKAVELAQSRWKRVDGLIVNHGLLDPVKKIADSSAEEWRTAYDVSFFSAVALCQAAIPALRESKGKIILTSSGAAGNAYQGWGAYGSAKAAMNHLALTLAKEEPDIVSLAIRPGIIDTEMQREIREKHQPAMGSADGQKFLDLKASDKLIRPEKPGHVMAKLVLDAPKELSGRFLQWDAEELTAFQE